MSKDDVVEDQLIRDVLGVTLNDTESDACCLPSLHSVTFVYIPSI